MWMFHRELGKHDSVERIYEWVNVAVVVMHNKLTYSEDRLIIA